MELEDRAGILSLIAHAESLIATVDTWRRGRSSAAPSDSSSTLESESTASSAADHSTAVGEIEGLEKFKRRIVAEVEFLFVRIFGELGTLSYIVHIYRC